MISFRRSLLKAELLLPLLALLLCAAEAQAAALPRTVLALYDGKEEKKTSYTPIHRIAEMPLNHLGLVVRYWDLNRGLPPPDELEGVRGILTWFQFDSMADPQGFLSWAERIIDSGRKFVVLGNLGVSQDLRRRATPLSAINRFLWKLGLRTEGDWHLITYDTRVLYKNPAMVGFERPLDGVLPAFERVEKTGNRATSHLVVRRGSRPGLDSDVVVTGPAGGYIAAGYTHYSAAESNRREWYVNPFEFFRAAFATDDLPKPDPSTLSGRRIFYSHVDGDGWRNHSEIHEYRKTQATSAEVILKEVIERFPDLPVTVGPVAGDVDPRWFGSPASEHLARAILALPQVEAGSHTYSHPLDWEYFSRARPFEETPPLRVALKRFLGIGGEEDSYQGGETSAKKGYATPRSYNSRPFDLEEEIEGSISYLNSLLPPGKKVRVLQWSGDTLPFERAVAMAQAAGVANINGGDTRFDREYPSYAWVAPVGRQVGEQRQIYASNSNENTYTDLWTDRYFGFQHLVRTIRNTETPLRVKPINVYYHMYSGQKLSSLNAVIENLNYARTQKIVPVTTSNYAVIADGFYTAQITTIGPDRWRIECRGGLQTIRFDQATFRAVDFARSSGVLGQRHYQGSLYVALDAADPAPLIALENQPASDQLSAAAQPYLIESRWQIRNLRHGADGFRFTAQGFGRGEMRWRVPRAGSYTATVRRGQAVKLEIREPAGKDGILKLSIDTNAIEPVEVTVTQSATP